jgi:hypothetical protein
MFGRTQFSQIGIFAIQFGHAIDRLRDEETTRTRL